jgi:hypothetical protein
VPRRRQVLGFARQDNPFSGTGLDEFPQGPRTYFPWRRPTRLMISTELSRQAARRQQRFRDEIEQALASGWRRLELQPDDVKGTASDSATHSSSRKHRSA